MSYLIIGTKKRPFLYLLNEKLYQLRKPNLHNCHTRGLNPFIAHPTDEMVAIELPASRFRVNPTADPNELADTSFSRLSEANKDELRSRILRARGNRVTYEQLLTGIGLNIVSDLDSSWGDRADVV